MKSGWLILGLALLGGVVGALYGAATWQESNELFAFTHFGQTFFDGLVGVVVGVMIGLVMSVALELWRTLGRRPGQDGH